jgi:hypothetical protein
VCAAVGANALELEFEPAISVARIGEELIAINVRVYRATDDRVNILIAIVIDVSEGDAMSLLQLPETTGGRDVLKAPLAIVAEHSIGQQRREIRIAGTDVEIEPAIIVQIPKIAAHHV